MDHLTTDTVPLLIGSAALGARHAEFVIRIDDRAGTVHLDDVDSDEPQKYRV